MSGRLGLARLLQKRVSLRTGPKLRGFFSHLIGKGREPAFEGFSLRETPLHRRLPCFELGESAIERSHHRWKPRVERRWNKYAPVNLRGIALLIRASCGTNAEVPTSEQMGWTMPSFETAN